jgi:predicted AAA+ superfamily ATPase
MPIVREALRDTPVVLLHGARQAGKSTLARMVIENGHPAGYLTLDDATVFQAATADPAGFIAGLTGPVVIDEWQRAGDLARAIKLRVDENREPGRFLLTGSASTIALPQLADSLAGRMEIITLWPLSQGEIAGRRDGFVDTLFRSESVLDAALEPGDGVIARIVRGGYPVAVDRPAPDRRAAWFDSYVTAILQRDVRDLANIERLGDMPRILRLLAARTASLLNYAELSSLLGIPQQTLKRYIGLLDAVFLIRLLPAYSRNRGRRLIKAPKVIVADSGLACFLLGVDEERLSRDRVQLGTLLEGFVIMEIIKQLGWSRSAASPMHFRDHAGNEVDLVLEGRDGSLVAVEVKAAATVSASDFKGMRSLAALAGSDFRRGVLLYTGDRVVPFAENMSAVPLSALWAGG